jgi:hypothetical protein
MILAAMVAGALMEAAVVVAELGLLDRAVAEAAMVATV